MIKKGYLLTALLTLMTFIGCSKESEPGPKFLATDNPLDSIDYFYSRAKAMVGGDVAIYYVSGVQKSMVAGTAFDVNWSLCFAREQDCFIFKVSDGYVTEETISGAPLEYEFIYKTDDRLLNILPPDEVWAQCVADHGKPLLNFSLYVPLYYPPSETFRYFFFTKEGTCYFGVDAFVYDAGTGKDITPAKGVTYVLPGVMPS